MGVVIYSDIIDDSSTIVTNLDAIDQQIMNILSIETYQVPGRPEFASSLKEYLHEFDDIITRAGVETEVENLLKNNVERIEVQEVKCQSLGNQMIVLDISYVYQQDEYQKRFEIV